MLAEIGLLAAVEILRCDDVGRQHRPRLGDFDILLQENNFAFIVGDGAVRFSHSILIEGMHIFFCENQILYSFQFLAPDCLCRAVFEPTHKLRATLKRMLRRSSRFYAHPAWFISSFRGYEIQNNLQDMLLNPPGSDYYPYIVVTQEILFFLFGNPAPRGIAGTERL